MAQIDDRDAWSHVLSRVAFGLMGASLLIGLVVIGISSMRPNRPADDTETEVPNAWLASRSARLLLEDDTRMAEVRRLAQQKEPAAVPTLARLLWHEEDREFRLACIQALGNIGDPGGIQALSYVAENPEEEMELRLAAARALPMIPGDRSFGILAGLMRQPDDNLRLAAIEGVALRAEPAALQTLADALDDLSRSVRLAAVGALAERDTEPSTRLLAEAVNHPDPIVRRAVVTELAGRTGPAALSALGQAATDNDEAVRAVARKTLDRVGGTMLERMTEQLGPRTSVAARIDAAHALVRLGGPEQASVLLRLLNDLPHGGRDAAEAGVLTTLVRESLNEMGEPALRHVIAAAVDGECDPVGEEVAAEFCRKIGKPAAAPIIESILKWKLFADPEELKTWISVLGDLGDPAAIDVFNRALAQDIAGIESFIETARAKIEQQTGSALPPCVPDAGILSEKADMARTVLQLPPPARHHAAVPDSEGIPRDGIVRITLANALLRTQDRGQTHQPMDLEIELVRRGDEWAEEFMGYAPWFNKRDHHGRIVEQAIGSQGEIVLRIEVMSPDDSWVRGGYGEYELTLSPEGSLVAGEFRGHFNFREVRGPVSGGCWQLHAEASVSYPAIQPGEHPRMLFRQFHCEALRERARTPFGRRVIAALRDKLAARKRLFQERVDWVNTWEPGMQMAIGHATLAHVFDDPAHGKRAAALVMERTTTIPYGGEHGERLPGAWITAPPAYDLTYPYLAEAEQEKAAEFFSGFCGFYTPHLGCMGVLAARGLYPNPGQTALSLIGEKGPFNWRPPAEIPPVEVIDPEVGLEPPHGVPINRLRIGEMIREWLLLGPFEAEEEETIRESLGPLNEFGADPDTRVPYKATSLAFVPLPPSAVRDTPGLGKKSETIQIPGGFRGARSYLYCVLEVSEEAAGLLDCGHFFGSRDVTIWLGGRELADRTGVILRPGRHRMLIRVAGAVLNPYVLDENVRQALAFRRRYDWEHPIWQAAKGKHQQTGEMTQMPYSLEMCRRVSRDYMRGVAEEIRTSGRYRPADHGCYFAASLRMATGQQLHIDTPLPVTANPAAALPYLTDAELCFGLGLVPDDLKPALVHEFNRRYLPDKLDRLCCRELVAALVHYPLDVKAEPLADPEARLFAYRDPFVCRFIGGVDSDIQCMVALRDEQPRYVGPGVRVARAGALLIRGQGVDWAINGPRGSDEYEAVLEVEDSPGIGPCKVTHFESDPSGTAMLSLDMSDVYRKNTELDVTAERHVGFDYTGRSGAAAVVIIVDRIRAPGRKTWTLPGGRGCIDLADATYCAVRIKEKGKPHRYVAEPHEKTHPDLVGKSSNAFALRDARVGPDGSSLRGVFLAPDDLQLTVAATTRKATRPVLLASTDQQSVDFFVVLTLQNGLPPKIEVSGIGLDAQVTIGGRDIRFVDGRIRFGKE